MSSRSFKGSLQFVKEHAAGLLQERKDRFAQLKAERKNKKACLTKNAPFYVERCVLIRLAAFRPLRGWNKMQSIFSGGAR